MSFVVIWRPARGKPWQVQPHVRDAARAAREASHLVNTFGGEAQALPVAILEDFKD